MSNEQVMRLHPITIAINFFNAIKTLLLPVVIFVFSTKLELSLDPSDGENFYPTLFVLGGAILFLCIVFIFAWIKWRKFIYWFEDGELRIEYGLFVKNKRYIPFERIQTLNYKEGILHRPFKLVRVDVETAGGSADAEVSLTAITREQASRIELEMKKAKQEVVVAEDGTIEDVAEIRIEKEFIYQINTKELILLATTSSSMGILFSAVAAIASQFNDFIPYERIYGEVQNIVRFGVLFIILIVLGAILLSWAVAILISYFVNYGFKLERTEEQLFLSKGLLEKKRTTLQMNRVQGIRIIENPIRQLFGYCRVIIDSAGGSGDEKEDQVVLLPFIKKKNAIRILQELFPEYVWETTYTKVPKKSLIRYLLNPIYVPLIPVGFVSYYFYPYGMWSIVLIPLILLRAYWQYKTAGFAVNHLQLTIVHRYFSKTTFVVQKNRIQSMRVTQSYFAERKDIASCHVHIMSSTTGFTAHLKHFDLQAISQLFKWYQPNK
ncbi:PH domain-containing protein [Kurthia gibsonii]|uniref:PH domain-containing protein n=1 Tax=Kurthia gibsonii TaxID=33946 RepID=UPI001144EA19|nr:PH domain-containing protein [Kurthia gibsonii]GED19633.1 UPF0699 transmembrane protein YdbT [Kurthia gibsonii]